MKKYLMLLCIMMIVVLSSCNNKTDDKQESEGYNIYYLAADGNTLVTEVYEAGETNISALAQELLNRMYLPEDEEYLTAFQGNFYMEDVVVDEKVVYVHFSEDYYGMDDVEEVLFRTAVVKTLCQVEGIEYVSFYIKEQPLINDTGNVVGLMSANDFVLNTDDSYETVQWAEVPLYYANSTGEGLICENKNIAYKVNVSLEQAIIEHLIEGPDTKKGKSALPKNLKILGVSTKDGVCYVNFDATFLDSIVDVSADVTIYSIVNSLCELSNIKKVQIMVNGAAESTFREKYPLTTIFERNLNLVTDNEQLPTE